MADDTRGSLAADAYSRLPRWRKMLLGLSGDYEAFALRAENRHLRAELDRARPVIDAATMWAADDGAGGIEIDGHYWATEDLCEALDAAVRAYQDQEPTDG